MDPITIPERVDPLPVGKSVFIPFDSINLRTIKGECHFDKKLATDLPPAETIEAAKLYMMNHRELGSRPLTWEEYSYFEVSQNKVILEYLRRHNERVQGV
jgi:hypothetical protein